MGNYTQMKSQTSSLYTPSSADFVCGGGGGGDGGYRGILFSCCSSVHPSGTLWFFPNILEMQLWIVINLCRYVDISKVYLHKKK